MAVQHFITLQFPHTPETAAVGITLHQEKYAVFPRGKKQKNVENSSGLHLISLTKPIISTFTPSHVHNHLLLQRGGKSRAGTEAGEKNQPHPVPTPSTKVSGE